MADKDVPFTSEWARNLQHSPDPNRVDQARVTNYVASESKPLAKGAPPGTSAESSLNARPSPRVREEGEKEEPSYYDISMLKAPVWKWEIASYFFLGGLSAGAYAISRMAARYGKGEFDDVERLGAQVALASFLPCPALLIHDLGDSKRFHHMLRVWKPSSPMNLGTWTIVGYSGMVTYEVVRKYLEDHERRYGPGLRTQLLNVMNHPVLLFLHDAAGVPFAILVAGYTGVLLSCTSNPLWARNQWLGPLFSASALSTGAAATSLALDLIGGPGDSASQRVLEKVDTASHVAEAACMAGFLKQAGNKAKPLMKGRYRKHMMFAAGALVGAEVLKHLPLEGRAKKLARMGASVLGLASGFAMRWAFIHGGHDAANDPRLARETGRPEPKREAQKKSISRKTARQAMHYAR